MNNPHDQKLVHLQGDSVSNTSAQTTAATQEMEHHAEGQSIPGLPGEGWHKLEKFDPDGETSPVRARLNGEWILIFRTKNGLRGVERACPHLKASLQDAILMAGDTVLRCKQHNFTFKLSDGSGVSPRHTQLRVFEIQMADGMAYGRAAGTADCPLRG